MANNFKDYKASIIDRASILRIELNDSELETLNTGVNQRVNYGLHEFDALDMLFFDLKNKQ